MADDVDASLADLEDLDPAALAGISRAREEAGAFALPTPFVATSPELQWALGELAIVRDAVASPDPAALDPAVAPPWWCAALLRDPACDVPEDALARLARSWPVTLAPPPAPVVEQIARHPSPEVARRALVLAREAIAALGLTPADASRAVQPLAEHPELACRVAYVEALDERWLDAPPALLTRLAASDVPALALPAIEAIDDARRLATAPFEGIAAALERRAVLGDHSVLERALLAAPPTARRALTALHRRGVFVPEGAASALLDAYLADPDFDPESLVRVGFTLRHAWVAASARYAANDPAWRRLAAPLAMSEADGALARLIEVLDTTEDGSIAAAVLRALPLAPRSEDAEAGAIAWLAREPLAAVAALAAHGGDATVEALRDLLARPLALDVARPEAIDLAFALSEDPAWLADLDPREQPARRFVEGLPPPPHVTEALLARVGDEASARLEVLADAAGPRYRDAVESAFRRAFQDEVAFDPTRRPRDPSEPTRAEAAVIRYGDGTAARGRRLSPYAPDDGPELLRVFLLRWLAASEDPALRARLLEALRRTGVERAHLRALHRFWRDSAPSVRRAAMELLLDTDGTEGLELSLVARADEADDEPTIRQGLRAIAHYGASWAAPIAAAALDHPSMSIKKAGAEALVAVADAACLAPILQWLGATDDAGLRATLGRALDRAAGVGAASAIVEEGLSARGRRRDLLVAALDGRLSLGTLRRLAREGAHPEVIEAARAGALAASDATADAVRDAFEAPPPGPPTARRPALQALDLGFTGSRARAAIDEERERGADPDDLDAAIARRAAEWLTWAATDASSLEARRILDGIGMPDLGDPRPSIAPLIATLGDAAGPGALAHLARDPDRAHARRVARALPPTAHGGLARWTTLATLGAVHTRADAARCLSDARLAGEAAVRQLGRSALGLEDDELEALRSASGGDPLLDRRPTPPLPTLRWREGPASPTPPADVLLRAHLDGARTLDHAEMRRAASALHAWPKEAGGRAAELAPHLSAEQARRFVPAWLEAAADGASWAESLVVSAPPLAIARAIEVDPRHAWALSRVPLSARALDALAPVVPDAVAEARPAPMEAPEPDTPTDLEGWLAEARSQRGRRASRAVKEVARLGDADDLESLAAHPDGTARHAVLRHLRRIAPRERYLQIAHAMLLDEPRSDLRRRLVRVLGHGAHAPAIPLVVSLLEDRDDRVRRAAEDAVRALGERAVSTLRAARSRARPDRRATYDAALAFLEA